MSALKHGLFRIGFMLCDRCVLNGECEKFQPKAQCLFEKEAFIKVVSELTEEFELESIADRILLERVAMYLIRIARAEVYEASVGVSEKSVIWGAYIGRLDNTLRSLLNDLAVTRIQRKQLDKYDALLVSVDEVLKKFAKAEGQPKKREGGAEKRRVDLASRRALLSSWRVECRKLRLIVRRGERVG